MVVPGEMHIMAFLSFMIPLLTSLPLFVTDGRKADAIMLTGLSASSFIQALLTLQYCLLGLKEIHIVLTRASGLGEVFGLLLDPMSISVSLVVITAGYAFMVYSVKYMTSENRLHPVTHGKGRFYGWMMLFIGATLAFLYSSTLIQLLLFFEIMSISCWGVVSYYLKPESFRASYKALIVTHAGALIGLFTAISYCVNAGISTSLYDINRLPSEARLAVFVAVMVAALAKSAQFPFYSWLPDAMVAPTPASAFLHGAAMVEMGVVLLARVVQFMQPLPRDAGLILAVMVTLTFFTVSYMVITQRDAKRLLAYSTIAESATMYAGLVAASAGCMFGLKATIFLLCVHAYVKGLAFLSAGLFGYYFGTLDMNSIKALLKSSPFLSFTWFFSLIGLAGVPPMPVFFGELFVVMSLIAVVGSHGYVVCPLLALMLCSLMFFIVFLRWLHKMLLQEGTNQPVASKRVTAVFKAPMTFLVISALASPFLVMHILNLGWG